MKFLADLFPIILFFVAYKLYGIYIATATAILAALLQTSLFRWHRGRFESMHLTTLALLVLFGGLTLLLRDPIFVMWKPTIVNWLFAVAFLISSLLGGRTLVERMLNQAIAVPTAIWRRLNWAWAAFFGLLGLANLYMVYVGSGYFGARTDLMAATGSRDVDLSRCAELFTGSQLALCQGAQAGEAAWVNFKLFGMMGLTILFVIVQALYLARHSADIDRETPAHPPPEPN